MRSRLPISTPISRCAQNTLRQVIQRGKAGLVYRDGVQVALVGRPNVGKSSLLNALLQSDRAIVTPVAGTTRDVIAETWSVRGIPVTLLDTAGIAETVDLVEQLGIERSRNALAAAAAAILVLDGSTRPTGDDLQIATMLRDRVEGEHPPVIIAINKQDLSDQEEQQDIIAVLSGATVVPISTQTGEGLERLGEALFFMLSEEGAGTIQPALINARQEAALARALTHLTLAAETRAANFPIDLMATDVRTALRAIGDVTGENVDEAVLTEIFSRFCIGK